MCGILGVFGSANAAQMVTLGLFAEQHRGQESCGMAVLDGKVFRLKKKMGLVKDIFTPEVQKKMKGNIAIGHVRYPTCGFSNEFNSQPHLVELFADKNFILSSNGDIVNYHSRRKFLEEKGISFKSDNDGELILKNIIYNHDVLKKTVVESIKMTMSELTGAYSTVLASNDSMYLFRDPNGFRPMTWGQTEDGTTIVASESSAIDILNPKWRKEVNPAQIIYITNNEIKEIDQDPNNLRESVTNNHCIFEHIYFSRPDSYEFNESVYNVRQNIGAILAQEDDIEADACISVPDSANFIALGYAKESGIPYEMGLIRNHYVGRTFIKPEQTVRDESVNQKFNPLPNFFNDKRVILIDDSIVRGTTMKKIVKLIRKAGAKEIHLRIGSPMVKFSCYYGIDTPTKTELIANRKSFNEIVDYLEVDSLKFISIDSLKKAVKSPDDYCFACFNGDYPVKIED